MVVFGAVVLGQHGHDRPRVSAQAHMSIAAAYKSLVGAPNEGARMSNRIVNTRTDYNPILIDDNSAHC